MDTSHSRFIGSDLCKPGCAACAAVHPDDDSTGARLLRRDDTPETKAMWDTVEAAAARVPSWVNTPPQQAKSIMEKKAFLPGDAAARKGMPICTGVFDYFPRALAYIAMISKAGNDQHNPGQPLHWDRTKSMDHADCIGRHLIERGTRDLQDNLRHSGKLGWRALANLELELEAAEKNGEAW